MNFPDAIKSGFKNYLQCSGRAARSEYWYWHLFVALLGLVLAIADRIFFKDIHPLSYNHHEGPLGLVFTILTFLPGFCVMIRRLHDCNRSGYWWLIGCTVIGIIPLLIWFCTKGTTGTNRFGSDPLG